MTQRFNGYIHSIVGHIMMISPSGNAGEQYRCSIDDFESIMPGARVNTSNGYVEMQMMVFHVKKDRIGVEHYRQWLGLAKIEQDRLANLESAMLKLIDMYDGSAPATRRAMANDPSQGFDHPYTAGQAAEVPEGFTPEEFAAKLMEQRTTV